MRLLEQYQEILGKGFRKHFPAWDEMSPFDPVKVIAEALAVSLAEIEARQTRFASTVLDALPSLCSFARKSARAPRSVYLLKPSQTLQAPRPLSSAEVFRFQAASGLYQVAPTKGLTLFPIHQLKSTSTGSTHKVNFSHKGQSDEIIMQFLPETTDGQAADLVGVHLNVATPEGKKTSFSLDHLSFTDQTNHFHNFGDLRFAPRDGEPFSVGTADFDVTLHFAGTAPKGRFLANSFEGELLQIQNDHDLGTLQGTAWEQVSLPDRCLFIPDDITLCYPDEQTLTIGRLKEDILRTRHHEPAQWRQGFFYNASQHSLVVPGGMELAREFLSGITVRASELRLSADLDTLPEDSKPVLGTQSSILEGVEPVCLLSGYLSRESASEYLKRFYSSLRLFSEQQSTLLGIYPEDLITLAQNAHPEVRAVELDVNAERGELHFYLLTACDEKPVATLPREVAAAVSTVLSRTIPTHYRWQISPFRATPLRVDVKVAVTSETAGMPSGARGSVLNRLEDELRARLPALKLPAGVLLQTAELVQTLEALSADSLSHVPDQQMALKKVDLVCAIGENQSFEKEIRRPAGTYYEFTVTSDLKLETTAQPVLKPSRRHGAIR